MKRTPLALVAPLICSAFLPAASTARASAPDLRLADVFDHHMVLQRNQPVKIWGWAGAKEKVTVSFGENTQSVTADADGSWLLELPPMPANAEGRELTAGSGSEEVTIKDVLVGDVWILSGQSNIQMPLWIRPDGVEKAERRLVIGTDHDWLRIMTMPHRATPEVQDGFPKDEEGGDESGLWSASKSKDHTTSEFSALGYHFGVKLHEEIGVPVGLVDASWGGTVSSTWCSRERLEKIPKAGALLEKLDAELADWDNADQGEGDTDRRTADRGLPTGNFNGMIMPLRHLTIRGVFFYQGENNMFGQTIFKATYRGVVDSFRDAFGRKDLPFCIIQCASAGKEYAVHKFGKLTYIQEVQKKIHLSTDNTGFVVTTDHTHSDLQPMLKRPIAERMVRWALADVYGRKDVTSGDAVVTGTERKGDTLLVQFRTPGGETLKMNPVPTGWALTTDGKSIEHVTDAENGNIPVEDTPSGFAIAGKDLEFVGAQAEVIDGKTVKVWAESVPEPFAVRYACSRGFHRLYTESGLPVGPFRTNNFDFISYMLQEQKAFEARQAAREAAREKAREAEKEAAGKD